MTVRWTSRWAAVLGAVAVLVALFVVGPPAAASTTAPSSGCAPHCVDGSSPAASRSGTAPQTCIRDAGCGGGASLTSGSAPAVAVVLGGAVLLLAAVVRWRRRATVRLLAGRDAVSSLFRPPQVLLDV